jgi:hypothetical protein
MLTGAMPIDRRGYRSPGFDSNSRPNAHRLWLWYDIYQLCSNSRNSAQQISVSLLDYNWVLFLR